MRYKCLIVIVLLLSVFNSAWALSDSLRIDLSLIRYSSHFEKEQFYDLEAGQFNALNFLTCLDSTANAEKAEQIKQKLTRFFDEKLSPIPEGKNHEKALKQFYNQIHDNLLKKYVAIISFDALLDKGEYNCLTASALYAMAFTRLNIPYQLRNRPDHVYVIANPGNNETVIETTDPQNGVYQYNDQYKRQFVDQEVKAKMISKEEALENSTDFLFQKYFYTSDTIGMRQLVAFHYYNNAVELMRDENYTESANQLMKAYVLNKKSAQVNYMLLVALSATLEKSFNVSDPADVQKYFILKHLSGEKDYQYLYAKYEMESEELALRQDDLPQFDRLSKAIFMQVDDSAQLSKFKERYYLIRCTNYLEKHDFPNAYENAAIAYSLNKRDVRIKALFRELEKKVELFITDVKVIDSLKAVLQRDSGLILPQLVNGMMFNVYLLKAKAEFDKGFMERGDGFLQLAEKAQHADTTISINHSVVYSAYASGMSHYYMQNKMETALIYVERGLKIDPENEDLLRQKRTISGWKGISTPNYKVNYSSTSSSSAPPPPPPPVPKRTVIVHTNK